MATFMQKKAKLTVFEKLDLLVDFPPMVRIKNYKT